MDNFYAKYPADIDTVGVTSLDGMTGDITIVAGTGISVVDGSGTITISTTGGSGAIYTVEYRIITSGEAAAKQLTLANTPTSPGVVMLNPVGGGIQAIGTDFTVTGAVIDWNGLGLDTIGIVAGDEFVISYTY